MSELTTKQILSLSFEQPEGVLSDILPSAADSTVLSSVLNRNIISAKSPREYCQPAYSALFSAALPFMKAGQLSFRRGEAVFVSEIINDLAGRKSRLHNLVLSSGPDSKQKMYPFNHHVEAEIMAEAYLKTAALDTYEGVLAELLEVLRAESAISAQDSAEIFEAVAKTEEILASRQIEVLNVLPNNLSKASWRKTSLTDLEPTSLHNIVGVPIINLDRRACNFDLVVPIIKDLLANHNASIISASTIGLGALSPLVECLDALGYLGIYTLVEAGKIKSLKLVKMPIDEPAPPQFGPTKAMQAAVIGLCDGSPEKIAAFSADLALSTLKNDFQFIAVSVLGAVATPQNPALAFEGIGHLNDRMENNIQPAAETFTFEPTTAAAITLDPVSVTYGSIDSQFEHFMATRLSFYPLIPHTVTPYHQGAVMIGVDGSSYESACPNGSAIAEEIITASYSFLSGERGLDQVAEDKEEGIKLLKLKYNGSKALRQSSDPTDEQLFAAISGKLGATSGMSIEVISLFYQDRFETCPIMFAASMHVPKFLSNCRTFPQRFELQQYLAKS
jgi:hypothetical protein